ncbi:xylan alpha-(1-_2)-glucuronosidase [Spirochaetia bacterium]|nr:xylan alpha-(1->2)-glucuronosidase [Spirochaetia bacterium]
MTNEYDCWFQDRQNLAGNGTLTTGLREILRTVTAIVPGSLPGDAFEERTAILRQAAMEFLWGLKKCYNLSASLSVSGEEPASISNTVYIGLRSNLNKKFSLNLPTAGAEGFVIKVTKTALIIAGEDERGCLYGVYRCLALLALGKLSAETEIAEAPAAPIRMINHWDNIDGSIERGYAGRSLFFNNDRLDYDPQRIANYARLLASVGINRISINNVNVRRAAKLLITEEYLRDVAKLAAIFRPFGIRLMLSINFSAPYGLKDLDTADPLDARVAEWWKKRADLIYRYIPDLAGFLVKADSEGEPGPFQYGRTHGDGANMLAAALKPHGGEVIWRCFVYNSAQDWRDRSVDRVRAAYDNFKPLDGSFADNVLLQIKWGPMDFQLREPVTPLFGALKKTWHLMELQITQEYTGQQIDLCYLPYIWEDIMNFDTAHSEHGKIKELFGSGDRHLLQGGLLQGLAAISNVGLDDNWTGHTLAQANLYGYGRLCWDPSLSAAAIAAEWTGLSFGSGKAADAVNEMLLKSYPALEKYSAPFGAGGMITPHSHYGPNVEGYEYDRWGDYHRITWDRIGIDRSPQGTGYVTQYAPKNAARFADLAQCPENLLLFFHRLPYDYKMKNGQTLLQNIYDTRFEGYEAVEELIKIWESIKDSLSAGVYESVYARLKRQLANAREWRDVLNTYFWRKTGIGDAKGRTIYE